MKTLLTIITCLLFFAPSESYGQRRWELKKLIDIYRTQYIQACTFPTDKQHFKKAIKTYMVLNNFWPNSETDSSITFSRPISYGGVIIDIPWEERWFYQDFRLIKKRYTGAVTVNIGIVETENGLDFKVIAYVRKRDDWIYDQCKMPFIDPELREYAFSWLGFKVPYWPQALDQAVEKYNQKQIYPDRRLSLN